MAEETPRTAATVELLERLTRPLVTLGYDDRDDIADEVRSRLDDDEVEADDDQLRAVVDRLWDERLEEQRGWTGVTDNDRLSRAFARLGRDGIVARENFTCCQSCGVAEIGDEVAAGDPAPVGYTFFHRQDTERAASDGVLYLAYGTFWGLDPDDEPAGDPVSNAGIGQRVVAALAAEGLRTDWNGSEDKRIAVRLTWRKRLAAAPPGGSQA